MTARPLAWAAFGIVLAFASGPALANPGPASIVFTHVHQPGGDLCAGLPVASCDEIVQVSPATGNVAFDFILTSVFGLPDFYAENSNVTFTIEWPADWTFVDAQVCGSGAIDVTVQGHTATFAVESFAGAPTDGQMYGLARAILSVTSEGMLECTDQHGFGWYPAWTGARAGVECGSCLNYTCDYRWPINPVLEPRQLELTADGTGRAAGQFHVDYEGWSEFPYVGEYEFIPSEPWLTVDTVYRGSNPCCPIYDATARADASALAPGVYTGWIEVRGLECYECEKIVFIVPNMQSIPDEGEARPETWGAIKARYR